MLGSKDNRFQLIQRILHCNRILLFSIYAMGNITMEHHVAGCGGNLIEMVLWYYHFDGAMNNNHEHVPENWL